MRILGDLVLAALGQVRNFRPDILTDDPASPGVGQIWYNSSEGVFKGFDGTNIISFASGGNTGVLQNELDQTQAALGLNGDGTFPQSNFASTNYLAGQSTNLPNLFSVLDDQIKTGADEVASNLISLNTLRDALGAQSDYTLAAFTGANYISAATTLRGAAIALDTQIKTNSDAIAANTSDIATKVNRSGDAMTGNLTFNGTNKVTGLAAPTNGADAATKAYVDAVAAGLDFQSDVLAIQVDADLDPGTPVTGDRYIITAPGALHASFGTIAGVGAGDIVEYDGSDFVVVYDVSVKGEGAMAWNRGSTSFAFYDGAAWTEFGGLNSLVPGVGLSKTGNVLNVNLGAGIAQLPTDEVGIDVYAAGGLFLTLDGSTKSTVSGAQIGIKLDGSTLVVGPNGLKVGATGITGVELAASVAGGGLQGGAGAALAVGAGTGITVGADSVGIDLAYADDRWLTKSGGTMSGALELAADPTVALHAATKRYVDAVGAKVAKASFVYDSGATSATTHTVVHGIGSKYCNVTVVDSSDKVIIPDSVTFVDATSLTVQFGSAITCKVIVTSVPV